MDLVEQVEAAHEAALVAAVGNALGRMLELVAAAVEADDRIGLVAAAGDPWVLTPKDWADALGVDAVDVIGDVVVDASSNAALVIGTNVTDRAVADVVDRHVRNLQGWGAKLSGEVADSLRSAAARGLTGPDILDELTGAGGPLSAEQARRIARTELPAAANGAMWAGWKAGGVPSKKWVTRHDAKVRFDHREADGQTVPLDLPFRLAGRNAQYPGDPTLPVELRVNCLPGWQLVAASGVELAYRRWFVGELVEIETAAGHRLAVTPNHPVMTAGGPVAAGEIDEGESVLCGSASGQPGGAQPDVEHGPLPIGELFEAFADPGHVERVPVASVDFHGDGLDGEIDVVAGDALLRDRAQTDAGEEAFHLGLAAADSDAAALVGGGLPPQGDGPVLGSAAGVPRRGQMGPPRGGIRPRHAENLLRGAVPDGHPLAAEVIDHRHAGDAYLVSEELRRFAGQVALDEVVAVRRYEWSGHVFNLQTTTSFYLAGGITVGNCRCFMERVDAGGRTYAAGLDEATVPQLADLARQLSVPGYGSMTKAQLRAAIGAQQAGVGGLHLEALSRTQLLARAKAEGVRGRWFMSRARLMRTLRARNPDNPVNLSRAPARLRSVTQGEADRFREDAGYAPRGATAAARAMTRRKADRTAVGLQSTTNPEQVRERLFREYGGGAQGYVPCAGCGLKLHWTLDAGDNPRGLAVMLRAAIRPGGGLSANNSFPVCAACAADIASGADGILR